MATIQQVKSNSVMCLLTQKQILAHVITSSDCHYMLIFPIIRPYDEWHNTKHGFKTPSVKSLTDK